MTDPIPADDIPPLPKTVGGRLREAREAQGLSLAEVGARTRVPLRQLEAIEADDYSGLPSVTYAVGFAKAYARAVGIDEVGIAKEVRGASEETVRRTDYEAYEIDDPKRTPSGGVLIASIVAVLLLLVAVGLWYGTNLFRNGDESATTATVAESEIMPPAPVAQPTQAAPTTGQVVLTATDEVWMRVYDSTGKTLFQNTLKPGERFEVPADAAGPMINVGRPDKLQVTLNGSAVPPLGDGRVAIKDVGISAEALTARSSGTTPAATPTTAPAATSGSDASVPPAFRPAAAPARPVARRPEPQASTPAVTRPTTPAQAPPGAVAPAPVVPAPAPTTTP